MPGYPTRKLLFGGPETRTKADMVTCGGRARRRRPGRQLALHGRQRPLHASSVSSASPKNSSVVRRAAAVCCAGSCVAFRLRDGVGLRCRCKNTGTGGATLVASRSHSGGAGDAASKTGAIVVWWSECTGMMSRPGQGRVGLSRLAPCCR